MRKRVGKEKREREREREKQRFDSNMIVNVSRLTVWPISTTS